MTRTVKYKPTKEQIRLLEVMLNPEHRFKTVTQICALAKISRMTYYRAFENQKFVTLYKAKGKDLVSASVLPVINAFVREAVRGSFQHGKALLEIAGITTEEADDDFTPTDEFL